MRKSCPMPNSRSKLDGSSLSIRYGPGEEALAEQLWHEDGGLNLLVLEILCECAPAGFEQDFACDMTEMIGDMAARGASRLEIARQILRELRGGTGEDPFSDAGLAAEPETASSERCEFASTGTAWLSRSTPHKWESESFRDIRRARQFTSVLQDNWQLHSSRRFSNASPTASDAGEQVECSHNDAITSAFVGSKCHLAAAFGSAAPERPCDTAWDVITMFRQLAQSMSMGSPKENLDTRRGPCLNATEGGRRYLGAERPGFLIYPYLRADRVVEGRAGLRFSEVHQFEPSPGAQQQGPSNEGGPPETQLGACGTHDPSVLLDRGRSAWDPFDPL